MGVGAHPLPMGKSGKGRAGEPPDGAKPRGKKPGWCMLEVAAWGRARLGADDAEQNLRTRLRFEKARKNYANSLDVIMEEYASAYPWPTGPKSWTAQESKEQRIGAWDRTDDAEDSVDPGPAKKKKSASKKEQFPAEEKIWSDSKRECSVMSGFFYEFIQERASPCALQCAPLHLTLSL